MKNFMILLLLIAHASANPAEDFLESAEITYGSAGLDAARFLVEHMPERDRDTVDIELLLETLEYALKARTNFVWATDIPEDLFLNDVLPYAVFDENREPWRADFYKKVIPLLEDAETASEAAQRLNRDFFNLAGVHYSTERDKPNQSSSESIASGKASCTGLSILLVNACRAAGIPARAAGTPSWSNKAGNHTWVEFWDDGWHFLGADEYDSEGPDRGWFTADAAQAEEDDVLHAIYATSWKNTGTHFPMSWSLKNQTVSAVNVTARYAEPRQAKPNELGVRLYSPQKKRVSRQGVLTTEEGLMLCSFQTAGEDADANHMPHLPITPGTTYRIRFGLYQTEPFIAGQGWNEKNIVPAELHPIQELSKKEAAEELRRIYAYRVEASHTERQQEITEKVIQLDDKTLRWKARTLGSKPRDGYSLWISMHGGGNAPAALNDQQWENQSNLYEPDEGIYVAPRAPTDTWNLWHEAHIDPMFQRLIEDYVSLSDVNPNRVYLMGYSAGGDGVWQLAPRMADRFAAASMMAGHPNESQVIGLRNLPFAVFVGADDTAYNRSQVVAEKSEELDRLHKADSDGYIHLARIYKGLAHWMEGKDQEALDWMKKFERNPWPRKIVWLQDDILHTRFYWLRIPEEAARKGQKIVATVTGQTIAVEGDIPSGLRIRLSDTLVDLNRPVSIQVNGTECYSAVVPRQACVIQKTLSERLDPAAAAYAEILIP